MSKFDECMAKYDEALTSKLNDPNYDTVLLTKVAKGLGPSIYNKDSSLVSGGDKEELERVKNNFLIKKLGLTNGPELDDAISEVVNWFGSSNPSKHRAIFYYRLVKKFNMESVYA